MSKVLIAKISEDPVLKHLCEDREAFYERLKERTDFLQKQADMMRKEADDHHTAFWLSVEAHLKLNGMLPKEYSKDVHTLTMDQDLDILYMRPDSKDRGIPDFIKQFLQ